MSGQLQIHLFLHSCFGAIVDLVDIDKNFNLDINQLELKLKKAKLENKLPKVILVHFSVYRVI